MKRMYISLPNYFTDEHNRAMADLVEKIAEDCIKLRGEYEERNEWKGYTVEVPEQVARIFTALSNADCLYAEEIE